MKIHETHHKIFHVKNLRKAWAFCVDAVWTDLLKVNFFAQPNFITEHFAQRNWPKMPLKRVMLVFPVLHSKLGILSRFLKKLSRRASSRPQLLEALSVDREVCKEEQDLQCSVCSAVWSVQCVQFSLYREVLTIQCVLLAVCKVQCLQCSVVSAVFTVQYIQGSVYSAVSTV